MTPKEAGEYVRARWRFPATYVRDLDSYGTDQFRIYLHPVKRKWSDADGYIKMFQEDDNPSGRRKAWLAAAEFTLQREEEIRQKREELKLMHLVSETDPFRCECLADCERILAILESKLAALLVGMKETP